MRRTLTTSSVLLLILSWTVGCPFNNPYEYYGQACSDDKPCDAPGLECVDGVCQGKGCTQASDCQAPFDACVDGRCRLPGASDAAARDHTSADTPAVDRAGVDASAPDSAAHDASGSDATAPDAVPPDAAGLDTMAVGDGGAGDTAQGTDAPPTDTAGTDTFVAEDSGGGWDAAGALDCTDAGGCPDGFRCAQGFCRPLLCDQDSQCVSPDFTCVKADPSAPFSGLCAPRSCSSSADCGHPLLACVADIQGVRSCAPRRGQPYQACLPGASWCDVGLDCFLLGGGGLGTCQQRCGPGRPSCQDGFVCVGMGLDATLATDDVGVCLATCGYIVDGPLPGDPELHCSIPSDAGTGNPPGLLLNIPEAFVGLGCNGPADCGGSFVCADLGTRGSYCLLTPEALLWQAHGQAQILAGPAYGAGEPGPCGGGLFPVTGSSGQSLCLPRCMQDDDCRFALPAGAAPLCDRSTVYSQAPGFCSVRGPFDWNGTESCFRPDYYVQGSTCMREATSTDADGDGFFSAVDQCDNSAGSMGGCNDWPCRVNAECGAGRYCVAGRCGTQTELCRPSCNRDEEMLSSFCPIGMYVCVPYRDDNPGFSFCVEDTDCTSASCGGSRCACVANTCVPVAKVDCPEANRYLDACVPADFVNQVRVACADTMDCPAGALCESGDGRCYFPGGGPVACFEGGSCPSGQVCSAGYCWDTATQTDCPDRFAENACLDCALINGPDARWTRPVPRPEGGCPCGMTRQGTRCFGKRVLCTVDEANTCPPDHVCRAGRCVAEQDASGDCPPWHAVLPDLGPASETCASCLDAQAEPPGWNLPCYASGDPICPCGLLCLPDADGNGQCLPAPPEAECVTDLADGDPCDGGGVWFDGQCRRWRGCGLSTDCDLGWVCAPDIGRGSGFCVPTTETCTQPGSACDTPWKGTCVDANGPDYCVPDALIPTGANVAGCTFAPSLCGPTCACMFDGGQLIPTELRPRDCGPDAFGLGDYCMGLTDLYTEADLAVGQPCYARGLPGRGREKSSGEVACAPTGELPSPGCTKFSDCAATQTCQLGGCYNACPGGQSDCSGTSLCLEPLGAPLGSTVKVCLLTSTALAASCETMTPFCHFSGGAVGAQGGICLSTAGNDVCYPRIGCDLLTEGETCVDGAPVMLGEVDAGALCAPWSRSPCRLDDAVCAAGLCHPTDGGLGLCGAAAECGHWLECGMGELCVGGRCRPYTVQAVLSNIGSDCDGRPYGYSASDGVIWTRDAAAGAVCLLAGDPRCGGRAPGQTCDQVKDPYGRSDRSPLVCSAQEACVEVDALTPCATVGEPCTPNAGLLGVCAATLRGLRCVP